MKIYGILVSYNDGVRNINEAFTTYEQAVQQIKYRAGEYLYKINDYIYGDIDRNIMYEIKEIEVCEKADKNKEDRVFYDTL